MAITYDVKQQTDDRGGYAKGSQRDSLQTSFDVTYAVEVSDPAEPTFDPRVISPFDVLAAPGLPRVNFTTYVTPLGKIIPYLICTNKQAARDESRRSRWMVTTQWATGDRGDQQEENQQPQDPPDLVTDFAPKIETALGEDELVRYSDKDDKQCLTPTGNEFDTPFIERIPTEIRRVTQYETFISYADMRERKFKTNSKTYRDEPIGAWFIDQVEATEVQVVTTAGEQTVAQVTYTLLLTERPGLWDDQRALIDTHYFDPGNNDEKTPFIDDVLGRYVTAPVLPSGLPNTNGSMRYDQWRMQDNIDFDSFLRA